MKIKFFKTLKINFKEFKTIYSQHINKNQICMSKYKHIGIHITETRIIKQKQINRLETRTENS